MKTAEYGKIHKWLRDTFGKADKCEHCSKEAKRFEYALKKDRDYLFIRDNFLMLCPSCHRKYDMTDAIRTKMSESKKGLPPNNKSKSTYKGKIRQYTKKGYLVATWGSLGEIYEQYGISRGNVSSVINGNRKTAGGFIWVV